MQPLLLILDEGCLLTATPPDLERGVVPLGPSAPAQPPLLGRGVAPLGGSCPVAAWHSQSLPMTLGEGLLLSATQLLIAKFRFKLKKVGKTI